MATVEPVQGDPDKVKITPWLPGSGCHCQWALRLPKDAIASVRTTEEKHFCCGKVLLVVELEFKRDASVPIQDIFAQVVQVAREGARHQHPFEGGEPHFAGSPTPQHEQMQIGSHVHSDLHSLGSDFLQSTDCPSPNQQMLCAGRIWCVPPGSVCCHDGPCTPPNNNCMQCAGRFWCVPSGSTCCHNGPCVPPKNVCMMCAGQFWCVAPGSTCCHDMSCRPGTRCVQEGGRFVCR